MGTMNINVMQMTECHHHSQTSAPEFPQHVDGSLEQKGLSDGGGLEQTSSQAAVLFVHPIKMISFSPFNTNKTKQTVVQAFKCVYKDVACCSRWLNIFAIIDGFLTGCSEPTHVLQIKSFINHVSLFAFCQWAASDGELRCFKRQVAASKKTRRGGDPCCFYWETDIACRYHRTKQQKQFACTAGCRCTETLH